MKSARIRILILVISLGLGAAAETFSFQASGGSEKAVLTRKENQRYAAVVR